METPLLAAALIVKDEEEALPGCLAALDALRPLLSQICVYDTGSSDRTVEIAEEAGAEVERGYWDGDFSRARNEAIAMTNAKWVLIVDADEHVQARQPQLRVFLRKALTYGALGYDALTVNVADIRGDGKTYSVFPSRRLLRPGRAEYRNRVHEDVYAIGAKALNETAVPDALLAIEHFGYTDEATVAAKTERNEAIANESLESGLKGEALIRALVDRARSRAGHGRISDALEDYRRVRPMHTEYRYLTWGMELFAELLISEGLYDEARDVIEELRAKGVSDPSYPDWLEARLLAATGHLAEAHALLGKIDHLVAAAGSVVSTEKLLEARMRTALAVRDDPVAIACLIRLVASYGHVKSVYLKLLVKLWWPRPPEDLATLLFEADRGHQDALREGLAALGGEGTELKELLDVCAQQEAAKRIPVSSMGIQESLGESFKKTESRR